MNSENTASLANLLFADMKNQARNITGQLCLWTSCISGVQ